jgi:hypothetical protein
MRAIKGNIGARLHLFRLSLFRGRGADRKKMLGVSASEEGSCRFWPAVHFHAAKAYTVEKKIPL